MSGKLEVIGRHERPALEGAGVVSRVRVVATRGSTPTPQLFTLTAALSAARFHAGSFEGGAPVQPVAIRCPFTYFNGVTFIESLPNHILRIFANPWCFCRVTFLPMHTPSAAQESSASGSASGA